MITKEADGITSKKIRKENLHFSVDSHLLFELGERLVAKPSIALAELVKNAYDADATSVIISFAGVSDKGGTITVEDNGEGITYEDLKTKWMMIGTDDKERNPISTRFRRPRTGRKGIGRFACRMISERLVLESVSETNGIKEKVTAVFAWDKLEPGTLVGDFEIEASREIVPPLTPSGTKLILQKARSAWSEESLLTFEKEISGLVNPFPWQTTEMPHGGGPRDSGLRIAIKAPEYPPLQGALSNEILKLSWGKLEGISKEDGTAEYHLTVMPTGKAYHSYSKKKYKELGSASFTIYMFSFGELTTKLPGFGLSDLRRLGREQGGVRVFLDGFRVFHYGDVGDDWLKLEFDRSRSLTSTPKELISEVGSLKRPMLSLPSNNQLFGAVFLSWKSNPNISLTVTRDRLLENVAFIELRDFVRSGIDWLTIKYAAYRAKEREHENRVKPKADPLIMLAEIARAIDAGKLKTDTDTANTIQTYVDRVREAVITQQEETIGKISMLRVLASTGTMISVFDHEIGVIIRRAEEMAGDLQEFLSDLPTDRQNSYRKQLQTIRTWGGIIANLANIIGLMIGKDARSKKIDLSIHKAVNDLFAPFKHYLDENGIIPINETSVLSRTPSMYESELQSILVNLMTNSIKALGEAQNKKICVRTEETKEGVAILFLDTGCGLPKDLPRDKWDSLFEPFVSYSMPSLDFGVGTGLGLTIVRDIVESYGGHVEFVDPPENWSTCIRLDFPAGDKNEID